MAEQTEEAAVTQANAAFYATFESLDPDEMDAVWAHEEPVYCVHPGWPWITGRDEVLASWSRIFDNAGVMQFTIAGVEVHIEGGTAWVVCQEWLTSVQSGRVIEVLVQTTNLFRKEDGRWLIAHHHGSPVM